MKNLLALFLFSCALYAQGTGTPVLSSDAPGRDEQTRLLFYSGNSTYVCMANSASLMTVVTTSSVTTASPAVVSAPNHGFSLYARPTITISGGTGNWAAFNGVHTATVVDANTFNIPVNTSGFGSVTGTLLFTTFAPRTNQPVWKVQRAVSNGTAPAGDTVAAFWATGGYRNKCDDRATLSYE